MKKKDEEVRQSLSSISYPKNEIFLKQLTKELKSKCATGGTYRLSVNESLIEIQGEKVDVIKKILQQHEIKFKGL